MGGPLGPAGLVSMCVAVIAAGCSASVTGSSAPTASSGTGTTGLPPPPCPVAPVSVVVSVDQWGDIVSQLAGRCAEVTTIIAGASVDPHDYEPTPGDTAAFGRARLVVRNGVGYDAWADKAVQASSSTPAVVDAGEVAGRVDGDNPHIWYQPDDLEAVAAAVSRELASLLPGATPYLAERAAAWAVAMQPYRDAIAQVAPLASGKAFAASEPVFDDMAAAIGLANLTPDGYRQAVANGSEPSPGDLLGLQEALRSGTVDVLVFNSQTEGAMSAQLRDTARDAAVPVVAVTETMPPGAGSFVQWQVAQLRAIGQALA